MQLSVPIHHQVEQTWGKQSLQHQSIIVISAYTSPSGVDLGREEPTGAANTSVAKSVHHLLEQVWEGRAKSSSSAGLHISSPTGPRQPLFCAPTVISGILIEHHRQVIFSFFVIMFFSNEFSEVRTTVRSLGRWLDNYTCRQIYKAILAQSQLLLSSVVE